MAVKTPCQPAGLNPWDVKFSPWNCVNRKDTITTRMIASFHQTRALFTRANHLMPT